MCASTGSSVPEAPGAGKPAEKCAVLLLAHGTPDSLDEIPQYLLNVTGGRPLPAPVVEEIRHRYSLIGKSPLTQITLAQGQLLSRALNLPVYVGMRNWAPYIADVVAGMRADGVTRAVVICLAPQNSRTSVGLYRRAVFAQAPQSIAMDFVEEWADDPELAEAFAERLKPLWQSASTKMGRAVPVLFTAHSVPLHTVQAQSPPAPSALETPGPDPYAQQARRTAANVAALLAPFGLTARDWFFAFQSQGVSKGPNGIEWLGPTVEETLTSLRQQGHSAVIIQPVGFLCDHVEILYDIDIAFRAFGAGIGLDIMRPPSLNDSPLLIAALAGLVRQGFRRLSASAAAAQAGAAQSTE
jgi:ferrochelatase